MMNMMRIRAFKRGVARCFKSLSMIGSAGCHTAVASIENDQQARTEKRKTSREKLWRDFFSNPSNWWDHRSEKVNSRYPDFKHRKTKQPLWLIDQSNPPWVGEKLAAMEPGSLQSSSFSWNRKLARYVKDRQYGKSMELFGQMQREGMRPDKFTFVPILNACASLGDLEEGRRIHKRIIKVGCELDVYVGSCLVDMYCKCCSLEDAEGVFNKMPKRDVFSWNAMVLGYVKCAQGQKALELFQRMRKEKVEPDPVTFVAVLNACASVGALEDGRCVHKQIIRRRCKSDIFVASSLVDMYAKCGSVPEAWRVFKKMPTRDVVAWSAMILGFAKCGKGKKALDLFQQMQQEGVDPNTLTFVAALHACAAVLALEKGRHVHKQIIERKCDSHVFVGSSLVDMYAKCGSIEDARIFFNKMPTRDLVSWNALLGGYAIHGNTIEALRHFECLCRDGIQMDGATFCSLLSACSHAGLVDEGQHHFESMTAVHNVPTTIEHYACMVDLLGRAGRLHEAEDTIKMMSSCEPNARVWRSLLGSCRVHGDMEIGERAVRQVLELEPDNAAGYVLLSNLYAAAGNWDTSVTVKQQRLERLVKKQRARTWIEVNSVVHAFRLGDCNHPQISEIRTEVERLVGLFKEAGYVPETSFMLHDVEGEAEVSNLYGHSEKLAIAFGLISTLPGTPLRIFKNLRVCHDCHTFIKLTSEVTGREIIVRDADRFHHFQDGLCSCRDYW